MRRSFALRLAAAFAGVGIAAAAITAILVNLSFGTRFTAYLEDQQRARQQQLVSDLARSYEENGGWTVGNLRSLQSLALMDGGTMVLLDANGHVVWNASAGAGGQMAAMHRRMMGSGPLGPQQRIPVRVRGSVVGTALIRLPQAGVLPQDEAFRSSVNRSLLLGGLVAGVIALGLGLVLARRATAPARELTRAARAQAAGDRSRRVDFEAQDEFGEMAIAFNTMADTIEEEDRLRRAFAADVAHELRTPLTILRTQIEGLQDGIVELSPASLASLHEEALRLQRLVSDLETVASAEAAGFSLVREPVRLDRLLAEAAAEFAGAYESAGIQMASELVPARIEADPTRIRQIVANLLTNALKFTPAGGAVTLSLRVDGQWALVGVRDTGPGIEPDELDRVFDRFFRGRSARAGGSGIGLTVARELARVHGGDLEVESTPGEGATFHLRLPLAASSSRLPEDFTDPSHAPARVGSSKGAEP